MTPLEKLLITTVLTNASERMRQYRPEKFSCTGAMEQYENTIQQLDFLEELIKGLES
jgi:3-methyladenine DNA glycosylase AlkD